MQRSVGASEPQLDHLFDIELSYRKGVGLIVNSGARQGDFIGTAEGVLKGERISGTVRVSLYAENCAYLLVQAGIEPSPGQHLCKTEPIGLIITGDGAEVWMNARGYGLRGTNSANPKEWKIASAVEFATRDPRYKWLNSTFGLWEGNFDEKTGRVTARVYAKTN